MLINYRSPLVGTDIVLIDNRTRVVLDVIKDITF